MSGIDRRRVMAMGAVSAGALWLGVVPGATEGNPPMPAELRRALEHEGKPPVLGNGSGDVTLTEFFDYNCPYCRKAVPVIRSLIAADPKLRVVFREWPIFGEGSYFAAQASLAAMKQRKYWQMHTALMSIRGRAEEASVLVAAQDVGLDLARLKRDMESDAVLSHIAQSSMLADHMELAGTPYFIAGNDGRFGGQKLKDLQALVAQARKELA
ncbi:DsbA family protein [Gemmobacter serpentinus]|uniref:DsbA family protein n=1 Tax=Gemmobacter serpentinus TaxID=2652247 RepID=UPI001CF7115D|nr:DsbA family protein [Gemmobacter serpentinus]